jgi:hypothetical protein
MGRYSKPPFGGPDQVLDYLGRYTHRIAISNNRLVSLYGGKVTFRWKNYKNGNKQKPMTLEAGEFIRRFLLHVLPEGFVRIRHFGFLPIPIASSNLPCAANSLASHSPTNSRSQGPRTQSHLTKTWPANPSRSAPPASKAICS